MTEDTFRIATNLQKDIKNLEEKRKQIFDFDKLLDERKPTQKEQSLFLNSMINIVDSFMELKKKEFKNL